MSIQRGRKVILMVILVFGFLTSITYSDISSRVEGTVTDKETGDPISGVLVKLFVIEYDVKREILKTKTGENGYFKFDLYFSRLKFFLQCQGDGYLPFLPDYYSEAVEAESFDSVYGVFFLAEGQIRHIKIRLKKGGGIKGAILKNTLNGVLPFKEVTLFLKKKRKTEEVFLKDNKYFIIADTKTNEDGHFIFKDLEPSDSTISDEYIIEMQKSGYNLPIIHDVRVLKNEENLIEFTVNLKSPPTLEGVITIDGQKPIEGSVGLVAKTPDQNGKYMGSVSCDLDQNGNYFFQGIPSGQYSVQITACYKWDKCIEKFIQTELEEGKTKVLNVDLKRED